MTAVLLNLAGPDLPLLVFLVFLCLAVTGIVLIANSFSSRGSSNPPPSIPPGASASDRLQELDGLKQKGLISDAEYDEQRRRILNSI